MNKIKEELMECLKAEKKTAVINIESENEEEKPKRKKKKKEEEKKLLCNICFETAEALNVEGQCRACVMRTVVCKRPDEKSKKRKKEWIQKGHKKTLKDVEKQKKDAFESSSETDSDEQNV